MTTTSKTIKQANISLSVVSKIILGVWYVIAVIVYLMGSSVEVNYRGKEYITKWFIEDIGARYYTRHITVTSIILSYYQLIL